MQRKGSCMALRVGVAEGEARGWSGGQCQQPSSLVQSRDLHFSDETCQTKSST